MKLSVIIIAKNAQDQIEDAINSCSFADEVIVIDGGSNDKTAVIATKLKSKVCELKSSNFSEMRNFGKERAGGEWILYVDSDERVSEQLGKEIKHEIEKTNTFSAYRVRRKNFYFGTHPWPYCEKLERLFKKEKLKKWYGELHESPIIDGKAGDLKELLFHYSHRDLTTMLKKTIEWSKIEAQLRYDANHPKMAWWRFPRVMITAFLNSYIFQSGWRAGTIGIIESSYQAFSIFITYARLWEIQEKEKKKNYDL